MQPNIEKLIMIFFFLIKKDLLIAIRSANFIYPWLFFILSSILFSIAINDNELLSKTGYSIIWAFTLLSGLLSLENLFIKELEDGSVAQWIISPTPIIIPVLAKIFCHWLVTEIPLILCVPLLMIIFNLSMNYLPILLITLLISTLIFSFIGAIGASLTASIRTNIVLTGLLNIPLYIPILIISISCMNANIMSLPWISYLLWLLVLLVLSITFIPFAVIAILNIIQMEI